MKLYFVTSAEPKITETTAFFAAQSLVPPDAIEFIPVRHDVQEIMHPTLSEVVRSKALDAFRYLRQPCVVEHGGLFFDGLPDLPGPLGKIIWSAIGDRMCSFLREGESRAATARAILGYCDGREIRQYLGETRGEVAVCSRGAYNHLSWDPIFIPEGSTETYGEMGSERKRATSPMLKAWSLLLTEELGLGSAAGSDGGHAATPRSAHVAYSARQASARDASHRP